MKVFLAILAVALCFAGAYGVSKSEFYTAVKWVEACGNNTPRDGDGGKAIGPYQIWMDYWTDCYETGGSYQKMREVHWAEQCVDKYMNRYCRSWSNSMSTTGAKACAAVHNGGPSGRAGPGYVDRFTNALNGNPYWCRG